MGRDQILKAIDALYAARMSGDKTAFSELWTQDATFQLMGEPDILATLPTNISDAREAIGELMDQFTFHTAERVTAVVEGNRAAVVLRITVSAGDGEANETQIFDLWELDDDGKAKSLIQFADTALIMSTLPG